MCATCLLRGAAAMVESAAWVKHFDHTAASSSPLAVEIDPCTKEYGICWGGGGEIAWRNLCEGFGEEWHRASATT
jgi:hypothetical protein